MVRRLDILEVFEVLWFDSLGAKSASIKILGNDCNIVVDPGAAAMQPSYPLSPSRKEELRAEALRKIAKALGEPSTRAVIITHYHYDHYPRPGEPLLPLTLFRSKLILAKNPNVYINESQWKRARTFYESLIATLSNQSVMIYDKPAPIGIGDPTEKLTIAMSRSFGNYDSRRRELLERGKSWFRKLREKWLSEPWIKELSLPDGSAIRWADSRTQNVCGIELKFTEPWFHGVEYDRTGWVIGFEARIRNIKMFYSSDIMGPIIEDYAEEIFKTRPDIVILDGPPTYLYPYMLNRINLERAIDNAIRILEAQPRLVVYDHHLLREKRWRERVSKVFREARKLGVSILTAAELLGKKPLIDLL
ncbi:MBL fold metallo-hydrolase [Pyrofollis japonicus]|uniref:MBL fold metallo-hydrolase n=1 Tax=Pyrofollis japonicus TaxID=3060460 RepID=UPI00295AA822|nr:MBL fold metallo-hydrolase [Pyrofollis japonicus]